VIPVRLLILTAIVFAVISGLAVVVRELGHQTLPTPTYLDSVYCAEQPCWQGLQPGVSTHEQVVAQIRDYTPYTGRAVDYGDDIVMMIELDTAGLITLGDVIRVYGLPEQVGCLGLDATTMFSGRQLAMAAQLYFMDGLIEVDVVRNDDIPRLTPDMKIRRVRYYAAGERAYEIGQTTSWHGFTTTRVYKDCRGS
jgi:hypothetical protein